MGRVNRLTVGLVCGGRSGEHEVSLVSGASVYRALDPRRYRVIPIVISHEGRWHLVQPPSETGPFLLRPTDPEVLLAAGPRPVLRVRRRGRYVTHAVDLFFPVLHGPYGEDGTIQGLFEMCGAAYVGAGVLGSAIGMDKLVMKAMFEKAQLSVAPYVGFTTEEWRRDRIRIEERILRELGLPCFIKPANSGSSVGITKVKEVDDLASAITEAFRFDRKVVAEKAVVGKEIECSVLGNARPEASLPGEVIPSREFYDYQDKYLGGQTRFVLPAGVSAELTEAIRRAAIAAYRAADCSGMARVDFFLGADGVLYVNEINTIPGFTNISMYPKMWQTSGVPYARLLDRLIRLAVARFREKSRLRTVWKQGKSLVKKEA
ncbi:MAG: D-alanine--D-alanine ligase family protein [Acidobacteriota bacterium]